jgi:hypothetical protein
MVFRVDRGSPSQNPSGLIDVRLAAEPHRTVRLFLETRTLFGGTPKDADGFGVFNLSDTFQNNSPSLAFEEAHVDVALRHAELRAGLQKFTWGRLDLIQPGDVINPRRFYDPFL